MGAPGEQSPGATRLSLVVAISGSSSHTNRINRSAIFTPSTPLFVNSSPMLTITGTSCRCNSACIRRITWMYFCCHRLDVSSPNPAKALSCRIMGVAKYNVAVNPACRYVSMNSPNSLVSSSYTGRWKLYSGATVVIPCRRHVAQVGFQHLGILGTGVVEAQRNRVARLHVAEELPHQRPLGRDPAVEPHHGRPARRRDVPHMVVIASAVVRPALTANRFSHFPQYLSYRCW